MDPGVGGVGEPVQGLGIEISQVGEAAAVQEGIFHVVNHALNLAFGTRTADTMGLDGEAIVVGKVGEERIEVWLVEPDLLHVVVENLLGPAAEESESMK